MATIIQWRRGTAAEWTVANPLLAAGEAGVELDTKKFKLGDGATTWNSLAYASGGVDAEAVLDTVGTALVAGPGITITPNDTANTITVGVLAVTSNIDGGGAAGAGSGTIDGGTA